MSDLLAEVLDLRRRNEKLEREVKVLRAICPKEFLDAAVLAGIGPQLADDVVTLTAPIEHGHTPPACDHPGVIYDH
jgi:hypothetical protein